MKAFIEYKNTVKTQLKNLASEISHYKKHRKQDKRELIKLGLFEIENKIRYLSGVFRHKHIAYCMAFNNTPQSAIETPAEGNGPNMYVVDKYIAEHKSKFEELSNAA